MEELKNPKLSNALHKLSTKSAICSFTPEAWSEFNITEVQPNHFVRSKNNKYFQPLTGRKLIIEEGRVTKVGFRCAKGDRIEPTEIAAFNLRSLGNLSGKPKVRIVDWPRDGHGLEFNVKEFQTLQWRKTGSRWTRQQTEALGKAIGPELDHQGLREALSGQDQVEFGKDDWDDFGIADLRINHFIKVECMLDGDHHNGAGQTLVPDGMPPVYDVFQPVWVADALITSVDDSLHGGVTLRTGNGQLSIPNPSRKAQGVEDPLKRPLGTPRKHHLGTPPPLPMKTDQLLEAVQSLISENERLRLEQAPRHESKRSFFGHFSSGRSAQGMLQA